MTIFAKLLLTAVLAVTSENLLFTGGIGFSRALRAARNARSLGYYSGFITVFSLVSILLTNALSPFLGQNRRALQIRPAVYALCVAIAYLVVAYLLKIFLPLFYQKVMGILPPAAINCVVLSMPYAQRGLNLDWAGAVGFALGTGIAFFFAALMMTQAFDLCRHEDMPKAFQGLPAVLVYVGILSMAFVGFTGVRLFG